ILNGSAQEYQILDTYYKQTDATSTVGLMQRNPADIVQMTIKDYTTKSAPLQTQDRALWDAIQAAFQSGYEKAYILTGPKQSGGFKGNVALILADGQQQALIGQNQLNGGVAAVVPNQTFADSNAGN